jgi:hypothetical protein
MKRVVLILGIFAAACGSGTISNEASPGAGGSSSTTTGGSTGVGGGVNAGGSATQVSVKTALPALPAIANVVAKTVDDDVNLTFDPVDGARDYRVYILPDDKDITSDATGHITVKNAIYRCAGDRQAPPTTMDGASQVQSGAIKTLVDGQSVDGVMRTMADATLGYVYATAGAGRTPVYAMGDSAPDADNDCYFQRWATSRVKKYATSESERTMLLAQSWRDDGIAFYVPSVAAANTRPVYTVQPAMGVNGTANRYYYVDGPEATKRGKTETAFQVLTDVGGPDTEPLMRVFYQNGCGKSHDELAAGKPRFERARRQGDQLPVFDLHWAGITGPTTLVVEALADGCPYQGFFATQSQPARDVYPSWQTLDQLRTASPTGEVYINGQHEAGNPKPIARSFISVSPGPKPDLDWFEGFGSPNALGTLKDAPCGEPTNNCWQEFRQASDVEDVSFMFVETDRRATAPLLGELWVTYGDVGADVNGKFRLTPSKKATLAADTFLHATMTVDTFTTGRRYPQIIISDQDVPVQWSMKNGYAFVVQTFVDWPNTFQLELCDHKYWDVNDQCPAFDMYHVMDPNDPNKRIGLAPNAEVGEHMGLDRGTVFDVYASTKRLYMFLDGEPYGCANLPSSSVPAGPVTVTFGDVLYHSGVDHTYAFTSKALQVSTRRHFDNLGFKSGVSAPMWDEKRMPCVSQLK